MSEPNSRARPLAVSLVALALLAAPAGDANAQQAKPAAEAEDEWQGLPDGPGREAVFYTCPACHSLMLVTQQGLSRDIWDETLDWMVEKQKMEPMDPKDRALALDYLAQWYGPDRKALNRKK